LGAQRLRRLLAVGGITLLAAALRLYRINSLPPAAGYDQAAYGLDALAIRDGARPLFLTTNLGREALFSYLVTLCSLVVRDLPTAIYVTSAVAGVLTVPAVYLAADEIFAKERGALKQYGALLSAFTIAIARWHLSWSRLGMRVILVPLFASLTVYLLWRGYRTRSRVATAGAGLMLGLGMYSYPAFRVVPLLVLLAYAYLAWSERRLARRRVADLAVLSVVAIVVFGPLGTYFATHRESATWAIRERLVTDSKQGWAENVQAVLQHAGQALLTFSVHGDEDLRVTLPSKPALEPYLLAATLVGIGLSLSRLKRPAYPTLLTWLGLMSLPAMLAGSGGATKRALGAVPAVAMLVSVGCLGSWEGIRGWAAKVSGAWSAYLPAGTAGVLALGFVYTGVETYADYFVRWSRDPALFTHFEVGIGAIGSYIRELPPDERIYLSPVPADHPSVQLYSGQREGIKTYHGRYCLVLPQPVAQETTFINVTAEDRRSLDMLQAYLPSGELVATGPLHYGEPYFQAYRVPAGSEVMAAPDHVREANWEDKVRLYGYDLQGPAPRAGEQVEVTLYYAATSPMNAEYTGSLQLLGPQNPATGTPLWAQDDSEPCRGIYPTSVWATDELVIDRYTLSIPPEAPPGEYQITMGFYNWWTMERLPVVDRTGNTVGNQVMLETFQIPGPP
jgi:hypothetical protein